MEGQVPTVVPRGAAVVIVHYEPGVTGLSYEVQLTHKGCQQGQEVTQHSDEVTV